MKRSEIRYALGRCKKGNPEPQHLEVLGRYQSELKGLGLTAQDFMIDWDVNFNDPKTLVFGAVVKKQLEEFLPKGEETIKSYIKEIPETPLAEVVNTATHAIDLDISPPPSQKPKGRKKRR